MNQTEAEMYKLYRSLAEARKIIISEQEKLIAHLREDLRTLEKLTKTTII